MISSDTVKKLDELHATQNSYRPGRSVAEQLAEKSLYMFVGATCEGKNTVMEAVAELDSRFRIAGTRTSREPRAGDDHRRYTYYPNTDEALASVFQEIITGKMVQYVVNPYAHLIYTSTAADYPGLYNLADVFSSAVVDFQNAGFKQAIPITIVTDPAVWRARFDERFPPGNPDRQARRDEAVESFSWSLAQSAGHFWVRNIDGQPEIAAQAVIGIATGVGQGNPEARQWAETSLTLAREIPV